MDSNSKKPNIFMWTYSVLAWFVSPTYACDLWEKWEKEKTEREQSKQRQNKPQS